jgi:hypothetical protein
MTNAELIEKLLLLPAEAEVIMHAYDDREDEIIAGVGSVWAEPACDGGVVVRIIFDQQEQPT